VLVLTRRPNQSIVIGGGEIVITVLEVRGDQVRLGIKAPREVQVHRDEVWAELQQANRAAALPDRKAVEGLEQLRRQQPKK
jgi:carbon storage regulator